MERSGDSIKGFYDGAEIFITGGTGYIGKVLIEKLLRTCQGIKRIYVLMRLKKATGEQRIERLMDSLVS
jgi:alcohol-forming fatty acyl-CoA reductase